MKMIVLTAITLLLPVNIYADGGKNSAKMSVKKVEKKGDRVQKYSVFLKKLDLKKIDSISTALDYFKGELKGVDRKIVDRCYLQFNAFSKKVASNAADQYQKKGAADREMIRALFFQNQSKDLKAKAEKANQGQKGYYEALKKNCFTLHEAEGDAYLVLDDSAIAEKIIPFVTPTTKSYLIQKGKEDKEGLSDDGALMITPLALARRIVFWELFVKNNRGNVMATDELFFKNQSLSDILFTGLDNTPAFDVKTKVLLKGYREAYEFIIKNHSNTEIGGLIKQYYNILKKTNFKQSKASKKFVSELPRG